MEIMIQPKSPVGNGTWIVEGYYVGRHGVIVANEIVHSRGNELIPVKLLHPRDIHMTVKNGEIAKLEEAESCRLRQSDSSAKINAASGNTYTNANIQKYITFISSGGQESDLWDARWSLRNTCT